MKNILLEQKNPFWRPLKYKYKIVIFFIEAGSDLYFFFCHDAEGVKSMPVICDFWSLLRQLAVLVT